MHTNGNKVSWRTLLYDNLAWHRAQFVLLLACNGRLATKDKMCKIDKLEDDKCVFCGKVEICYHILFYCQKLKGIWMNILNLVQVQHKSCEWHEELIWLTQKGKGKGLRAMLLKGAATETVYSIWRYRNYRIFRKYVNNSKIDEKIIYCIVYRNCINRNQRKHLANLMI